MNPVDTYEWVLLGVLVVVAVVLILGATSVATQHSENRARVNAELDSRLREIVDAARWVHDSGSLDVIQASDSATAEHKWKNVRARIIDVEADAASLSVQSGDRRLDSSLEFLAHALTGLRSSLDVHVRTLIHNPPVGAGGTSVLLSTQGIVEERRRQVETALAMILDNTPRRS